MAEEGIRALAAALPSIFEIRKISKPERSPLWRLALRHRSRLAGMALHHKLCHVLGGSFNLPHAETHSIVLPHAMRYNSVGCAKRCSA